MKPNMIYNMIKIQILLHQALHYNQIYNFTLNHDYKFKTIIVFKDVWVLKFKRVYAFLFFECFEHMDPFLWNILKFTKKIQMIWCKFDKKKYFYIKQKKTHVHMLEFFKHVKRLLKHGEFSWKFCSCNFESIRFFLKK
jgi:hypothetical protein